METVVGVITPAEPGSSGSAGCFVDSLVCGGPGDLLASVAATTEILNTVRAQAMSSVALMSTGQAAALAAEVEAISRTVEYLQIVCAGALETHRVASTFGANPVPSAAPLEEPPSEGSARVEPAAWNNTWALAEGTGAAGAGAAGGAGIAEVAASKVHAEFRSTADYLRSRLRISRGEAQRRLKLASALLPTTGTSGQPVPAQLPALAEEAAAGTISSAAATVVADAVEQIRHRTDERTATSMESDLAAIAAHQDRDFLVRTARRWLLLVNQDGAEPTEEELRRFQGIFPGRRKNGLNHLNIYCTDDQHETLLTVMNAAAGPRVSAPSTSGLDGTPTAGTADTRDTRDTTEAADAANSVNTADTSNAADVSNTANASATSTAKAEHPDGTAPDPDTASRLDRRSRPQRLLGGLVDAAKAALAAGGVPTAGGLRPQVMVTIDAVSLLKTLDFGSALKSMDDLDRLDAAGQEPGSGQGLGRGRGLGRGLGLGRGQGQEADESSINPGAFAFSGPVPAATVRKLACDADLLPVVLSGEGRILDIGREQRLFPPHLRKALHARDGGCAFPGCSIPGPWTEAHHIEYWSRGGPTSTDNGVLLCSHHHHEIHKENWAITLRSGIPWFGPPAYVDPDRAPLRNTYFRSVIGAGSAPVLGVGTI